MRRSSFIFQENHVFIEEEDNPSDKVVMVKERLDSIDIDGIRDLVYLPTIIHKIFESNSSFHVK